MLGVGVLIPVIPQLLANPNSPYYLLPAGFTLAQGFIILGFLTAIYPIMQFFATPILGQLSDKFGRKNILLISLAGTCLGYLVFAYGILTHNLVLLFVSRAFDGITGGNISVAQAAIADITLPENRAKSFGLIGMAFGLGFVFGPFLGGKLSDPTVLSFFNDATPFWFAAFLTALNILSVGLMFPETLKEVSHDLKINWVKSLNNIGQAIGMKEIRHLFATGFLFQGGFSFFTTFFGVYLIEKFGFTQGNIGDFYAALGICIALSQAIVVRQAVKYFKGWQILRVSMFANGLLILAYLLPTVAWQLFLVMPFFAVFNGLTQANLSALVSQSVGPKIQGQVLGINSGVQALAQAIPPIVAGFVAASFAPSASLIVAAAMIFLAGVVFWMNQKKHSLVVMEVK